LKTGDFLMRVLLAFVVVLTAYAVLYRVIEHRRTAKGPWQVTFTHDPPRAPTILIHQPALGLTNCQIQFLRNSNAPASKSVTLTFDTARKTPFAVPFGRCVFQDTIFLPGTVVLQSFGHQIQLMPRVLTIDGVERQWHSGATITLTNAQTQ
jgi:hypothetical protein